MFIYWYGASCFEISSKVSGEEISLFCNPFDKDYVGFNLRKVSADIVASAKKGKEYGATAGIKNNEGKSPFVVDMPGEYEKSGIFVCEFGFGDSLLFKIALEGITLGFIPAIDIMLSEKQLEFFEDIDVLLLSLGGEKDLSLQDLADLVVKIDPKIVIPFDYKLPESKQEKKEVTAFCKKLGGLCENVDGKLKLTKTDIPEENTKIIILAKS